MRKEFDIRADNVEQHIDIEKDIQAKQNGHFTFTLRVNAGKIVDYSVVEYVSVRDKYLQLKSITFEEHTIAHYSGNGNRTNAIRPNNLRP